MDPKSEGLWGPPSAAEVTRLIHQLQDTDPAENDLRADAAFALGQLGSKEALEALIEALHDEDTVIRTEAAGALGGLRDRRAVEPLIRALYDSQWEVRSNAALSLGALGDGRALPHLLTALEDANDEVRFWAARSLGDLGDPRALPALQDTQANDSGITPEGRIRDAAAAAIARLAEGAPGAK